jgi:hypothetical protein
MVGLLHAAGPARADSNDLKREISVQQSAANDLQSLDTLHAVADEIALFKTWLDEAWNKQARAREILDRCLAQADLIRVKIAVSKVEAEAAEHEKAARDSKENVKKTQKALEDAIVKKKAMEMNAK